MARRKSMMVVAALVASSGLIAPVAAQASAGRAGSGVSALRDDASSTLTTMRGDGGLRFAGVGAGARIDNPDVGRGTGVEAAARAHLKRYGGAFGADRPGTTLHLAQTSHTVSGQDVVRFQQRVDDVPVLGGQVVLSLRSDRELASVGSTLSPAESVAVPHVTQAQATAAARALVGRSERSADLQVSSEGRWVFDPSVFGQPAPDGVRTGWRLEVTDGAAVRRLVLIDDQSGAPILNLDENEGVDRVVCDNANVPQGVDVPCASGFARTEGSGPSTGDVESAFQLSGAVADFYSQVAGLDLTDLLGVSTADGKKLASTVNWCYTGDTCPMDNAFWDGTQMYYGAGYAGADDVVGHEMTHGVIDHFSQLFYFGQSGAINESLADIMGEIVDHRNVSPGDAPDDWSLGEDLPGGALRSMSDPTAFNQPDRMTSSFYTNDVADGYGDNGGVHTDSGVGNKTAYLISQGGSFNGQTITGIDAGDPELTKTATLYADVLEKLNSGSDYADLAARLDQSCQDLVTAGTAGFTSDDCAGVHAATLATELRTTPTFASQPDDASANSCPVGTQQVVMFDSESGNRGAKFTLGNNWSDTESPYYGSNATSDVLSWSNTRNWSAAATAPASSSLTFASAVNLPAGQPSYLWFQGWYLLDYDNSGFYDAGTVEVNGTDAATLAPVNGQPAWINGPTNRISNLYGNPAGGRLGFGGDSHGWIASQLDLSSFAGHSVRPRFTLNNDNSYSFPGWFLDDIRVYTCSTSMVSTTAPVINGPVRVGSRLTATSGGWLPAPDGLSYQWLKDGGPISGAVTTSYTPSVADVGHRLSVRVTASGSGLSSAARTSSAATVAPGAIVAPRPRVTGTAKVRKLLTAVPGTWRPSGVTLSYQWLRSGKVIRGATKATYKLTKADRGKAIAVRVTGHKVGYSTTSVTSARTPKVK